MNKIIIPLALLLALSACSFNTIEGGDPVEVNINLNTADAKAPISAYTYSGLTVSGSGMDTISLSASQIAAATDPYGRISVMVTPGNSRTFGLTVTTGNIYYSGAATVEIAEDSTPTVTIPMRFNRSNILIPDRYNSRLVQINGMTGAGWIEQNDTDIENNIFSPANEPVRADYDNYGNIYVQTIEDFGEGVDNYIYKTTAFVGTGTEWELLAGPFSSNSPAKLHVEKDTGYIYAYTEYDAVSGNSGDYIMVILPDGSYGTTLNVQDLNMDFVSLHKLVFIPMGGGTIALAYVYNSSDTYIYAVVEILRYSGGSSGTWTRTRTPATDTGTIYSLFYAASFSALKYTGNSLYLIMKHNYWDGPPAQEEFRSVQYTWDETTITNVLLPNESYYYSYETTLASTISYIYMDMFNDGTSRLLFYATQEDGSTSALNDYILQFPDPTLSATEIPTEYGSRGTEPGQFMFYPTIGAF